jgi:hypothetical protein
MHDHNELLDLFIDFIEKIGIPVSEGEVKQGTFLPSIEIRNGGLIVDRKNLEYPGDLLHEAGHIAVTRKNERSGLCGNVTDNNPEKDGDEFAVLLWTYAVCLHLRIHPSVVFHEAGYKGDSQWLINTFENGTYMGLPLLVWMGLAHDKNHPQGYPAMIKWLRD